jgi:hypothetical protein
MRQDQEGESHAGSKGRNYFSRADTDCGTRDRVRSDSSCCPPIVPVLKKIERHLSDEDLVDAIAIQNLISGGLVTVSDNPHLGGIATMKLTAQERARGWKVML